jgi:hypothetical protein
MMTLCWLLIIIGSLASSSMIDHELSQETKSIPESEGFSRGNRKRTEAVIQRIRVFV